MPARPTIALCVMILTAALSACARFPAHGSGTQSSGALLSANLSHGKAVFAMRCAVCHGAGGSGGPIGPALRGERNHRSRSAVAAIVKDPLPPMPKLYPARMDAQDVLDVSAYVDSL